MLLDCFLCIFQKIVLYTAFVQLSFHKSKQTMFLEANTSIVFFLQHTNLLIATVCLRNKIFKKRTRFSRFWKQTNILNFYFGVSFYIWSCRDTIWKNSCQNMDLTGFQNRRINCAEGRDLQKHPNVFEQM